MRASFDDVSPGGIRLLFPSPVREDSRFIIGLRRGRGQVTVILYQARHCGVAKRGDGHTVGAQLVKVMRERELLFGAAMDSPMHRIGRLLLGENAVDAPESAGSDLSAFSS